ncbi:hypothetical protein CDIK_2979 [Cucumispora dikerogammari]|nr:hypothetical protein CDIK_2979 [Cucumispora dikerogammari]
MELEISDVEPKFKDPLIIKAFIEAIENPEDVMHLILVFLQINVNLATILSLKIKGMIKLKHITLELHGVLLEEIEEIFIKIFENINGSFIESLNFNFCFVHSGAPEGLCKFLGQAKNLEYFEIFDQKDESTGIIPILQNLVNSKCKIKYLNIDYKNFDLITERRPGLLISQLQSLDILFIFNSAWPRHNSLSVFIEDIKHLKLKQLDLCSNTMSPESCSLLGNMFGKNEMKRLDISCCDIYDNHLLFFLNGWEQGINTKNQQGENQTSLEELVLTQLNTKKINAILELHEHILYIAEEEKRKYKQFLNLSYNNIKQNGINVLADFMKDKMNIKITFLGYETLDTSNLVNIVETNLGFVELKEP